MAGIHNIRQPSDRILQAGDVSTRLEWGSDFARRRTALMNRKQQIVDSEALRYCVPLLPFRNGALTRSGTIGTVIGSGELKYVTPYARFQYYCTAQTRDYDPRRGGKWFERMKAAHKQDLLRAAEKG